MLAVPDVCGWVSKESSERGVTGTDEVEDDVVSFAPSLPAGEVTNPHSPIRAL
jgi:hypothetical protein